MHTDPELGVYWRGHCHDSMKRERQLIVDFLCDILGGPVIYMGRDMKTSHDGLDISERDWEIFVNHTVATLGSLEVHGKDREDCLVVVEKLAGEIVENAKASTKPL